MTKLVYPSEGIYRGCQLSIEKCIGDLLSAVNSITTSCPSEFNYSNYMNNLRNDLRGYYKSMNNINNVLKRSDSVYERVSDYLESSASKMIQPEMSERDRMIV